MITDTELAEHIVNTVLLLNKLVRDARRRGAKVHVENVQCYDTGVRESYVRARVWREEVLSESPHEVKLETIQVAVRSGR